MPSLTIRIALCYSDFPGPSLINNLNYAALPETTKAVAERKLRQFAQNNA